MTHIGPTDGNLYALRQREAEQEAWDARFIDCPDCNGTGELEIMTHGRGYGDPDGIYETGCCDRCDGTGEIEGDCDDED